MRWTYKSDALDWLRVRGVSVPAYAVVQYEHWRERPEAELERLHSILGPEVRWAVRSDRLNEDAGGAGAFHSVLDVNAADPSAVGLAVGSVLRSYGRPRSDDRILVQHFVGDAQLAGVAASCLLPQGLDYRVVSWVARGDNTLVTGAASKCWTAYLNGVHCSTDSRWTPLLAELQRLLWQLRNWADREVEIEWLWNGRLQLVQLRALPVAPAADTRERGARALARAHDQARRTGGELLGLMPDWNPAELLGEHPRQLALSLFRELISRRTWAQARARLGYLPVGGELLRPIAGRPYVRVGRSLRSLLPATLGTGYRDALVAAQLRRLRAQPSLHDKLEFEVATGSYEFRRSWRQRYPELEMETHAALEVALRHQLSTLLDPAALARAYEGARFALRTRLAWPAANAPLATWRQALRRVRDHYALPFAQSARRCFVYELMLQTAVHEGAMSEQTLDQWRASAHGIYSDGDAVTWFQALRPGTFEIANARYGERFEHMPLPVPAARPTPRVPSALERLARGHGIEIDSHSLLRGFVLAHQARDWGKLALSLALSEGLEHLVQQAHARGHSREDLSWLTLSDLDDGRLATWPARIAAARQLHVNDGLLRLPPLLREPEDVHGFILEPGHPAFVGSGRVWACTHSVSVDSTPATLPSARALLLERCEPGFDWVYGRRPAVIVTAYGGPNAHVALRAHELGCPALLGVGTEVLQQMASWPAIEIDFDQGWWRAAPPPMQAQEA